jgi:hypothetical protein
MRAAPGFGVARISSILAGSPDSLATFGPCHAIERLTTPAIASA